MVKNQARLDDIRRYIMVQLTDMVLTAEDEALLMGWAIGIGIGFARQRGMPKEVFLQLSRALWDSTVGALPRGEDG